VPIGAQARATVVTLVTGVTSGTASEAAVDVLTAAAVAVTTAAGGATRRAVRAVVQAWRVRATALVAIQRTTVRVDSAVRSFVAASERVAPAGVASALTAKQVRRYPFVTTFYPLWTGIATRGQAARIMNNLEQFERAGGLQTSTQKTGSQWDAPFGWAPMQMIAVAGMRRYGYNSAADRIAIKFLSLVLKEFNEHNVIVEKYDVERRDSQIRGGLRFGYPSNEIGFGWTNAAFLELYSNLPELRRKDIQAIRE
jgi:hypothetical protein